MSKLLDLNKNVYSLCGEYPEVKKIMASAGFTDITKPAALNIFIVLYTGPFKTRLLENKPQ